MFKEIAHDQVYKELLIIKIDEMLHVISEKELIELILHILTRVRKKPMKKEVKMIYT
jgi:hypothetical protein